MGSDLIIGLEMALTLGLVLGWGFWELRKMRRLRREREEDK